MARISHEQWYSDPKYKGVPYAHKQFWQRFDTEEDAQRVLDAHADLIPHEGATWIGPGGYGWDEWRTWDVRRRAFHLEHYARFKEAKAAEYAEAKERSRRVNAGLELRWWQRRKFRRLIERGEQPGASAQDRRNAESARDRFVKAGEPVPVFVQPPEPPAEQQRRESQGMVDQLNGDPEPAHALIDATFTVRNTKFAAGVADKTQGIVLRRGGGRPVLMLRSRGRRQPVLRIWAPDHDGSRIYVNGEPVVVRRVRDRWEGEVSHGAARLWRGHA